jgi:hypothetical protein
MSAAYVEAVARLDWLLAPLEEFLEARPVGSISEDTLVRISQRTPSLEQMAAVSRALISLGILTRFENRFAVVEGALDRTSGYRRGVRDALALATGQEVSSDALLCAALPGGLDSNTADVASRGATDLRACLFDVVTSAQRRVVMASPFWDRGTAEELAEVLRRRLVVGVRVDLLGRAPRQENDGLVLIYKQLADQPRCKVWTWERSDSNDRWDPDVSLQSGHRGRRCEGVSGECELYGSWTSLAYGVGNGIAGQGGSRRRSDCGRGPR